MEGLHDKLKLVEEQGGAMSKHHPETLVWVRVAQGQTRASQLDSFGEKGEGKEASRLTAMSWPEMAGGGQARRRRGKATVVSRELGVGEERRWG